MQFSELLELIEASMLDISIETSDKFIAKHGLNDIFSNQVTVEAKTDGVKLTVIKIADEGKGQDYLLAYKGNVLYSGEYDYADAEHVSGKSIGASQFKIPIEHFRNLPKNKIPVGTELQIEFLMRKPTLSSNYSKPHGMVLIGYSKSKYSDNNGILVTKNTGMMTAKRDEYADEILVDVPHKIFKGRMDSAKNFAKGCIDQFLLKSFNEISDTMDFTNREQTWAQISDLLLKIPSVYGGTEEGVVLKFKKTILKVQQSYQLDQAARKKIKDAYRADDPADEASYWDSVTAAALDVYKEVEQSVTSGTSINDSLRIAAKALRSYALGFGHSKKNPDQIKDDVQLTLKKLILKNVSGNNGCLILGKFRVLTNGHFKLISDAVRDYDRVAVCLVTGKDTKSTRDLRYKMLKTAFGNKITIVESSSGNLLRIISSVPFNVNTVFAGTDRVQTYQNQLAKTVGTTVREMQRTDDDISATKVIANLADFGYFKANTPRKIHKMYDEICAVYLS